jgi:hypothetical protein
MALSEVVVRRALSDGVLSKVAAHVAVMYHTILGSG